MATRDTTEKAQELKTQFETNYPGAQFRIVDQSTARYTEFAVLEVRNCERCGAEVLTAAVGEYGLDLCRACTAQADVDAEEHHRQRQAEQQAQASWSRFHDEVLNS